LNNTYYETLDKNFNEAIKLIENSYSHAEIIEMLRNGNIPQKQFAALELKKAESNNDIKVLLENLTGQDGKIREAVSLKIKELITQTIYKEYFLAQNMDMLTDKFLDAIIDINGNICRNILDSLTYIKCSSTFTEIFTNKLTNLIFKLIDKIKDFDFKDGKYKVNKEVFKLYWCLEAVYIFYDKIDPETLKKVIRITKNIDEYTIREKTAKILSMNFQDHELIKIRQELKQDKNYYVRRY